MRGLGAWFRTRTIIEGECGFDFGGLKPFYMGLAAGCASYAISCSAVQLNHMEA